MPVFAIDGASRTSETSRAKRAEQSRAKQGEAEHAEQDQHNHALFATGRPQLTIHTQPTNRIGDFAMKRDCATAFDSDAESNLKAQLEELRAQNEELKKQVAKQAEENSDIKKENKTLRADLLYEQTIVSSLLEDEADCRELLDDADQVNQDLKKRIEELYRLSESSTVGPLQPRCCRSGCCLEGIAPMQDQGSKRLRSL